MGCVARRLVVGAALCCALAAVPGAWAASGGIPSSEAFGFTGSLTYSWHGDRAHGCARENLCSVIGSITFRSDGSSQAFGGIPRTFDVDATGTSVVRVRRGDLGAAGFGSGDCVEVDQSNLSLRLASGSSGSATSTGPLSSGRCAVPRRRTLTGSLTVSLAPRAWTLRLDAERVVHRRAGRARALSDLLARRLAPLLSELRPAGMRLRVGETTERGGAPDCGDAVTLDAVRFGGPVLSFDQGARTFSTAACRFR
jgi:hypothetical protein